MDKKFKLFHGVLVVAFILVLGFGLGLSYSVSAQQGGGQGNGRDGDAQEEPQTERQEKPERPHERGAGKEYAVEGEAPEAVLGEGADQHVEVPGRNDAAATPGSSSQPLPTFSGLNVKGAIVNTAGSLLFFDDAILYGLNDVRVGLINNSGVQGGGTGGPQLSIRLADTTWASTTANRNISIAATRVTFRAPANKAATIKDITISVECHTAPSVACILQDGALTEITIIKLNEQGMGDGLPITKNLAAASRKITFDNLNWTISTGQTRDLAIFAKPTSSLSEDFTNNTFKVGIFSPRDVVTEPRVAIIGNAIGNPHTIAAPPRPDFTITQIYVPANMTTNQSVQFDARVRNSGTAASPPNSNVRLYFDLNNDDSWGDRTMDLNTVPSLITNNSNIRRFGLWTTVAGRHKVKVCADAIEAVRETNEDNNCLVSDPFTVTAPDLTVSDLITNPTSWAVGNSITISATASNQGNANAGNSVTRLKIMDTNDPDPTHNVHTRTLDQESFVVEGTQGFSFHNTWTAVLGSYRVQICVDDSGLLTESNENNNCVVSDPFTVAAPDLTSALNPVNPTDLKVGNATTFTGTIQNEGTANAGASNAKLHILDQTGGELTPPVVLSTTENALTPSATQNVTFTWAPQNVGTYTYKLCADEGGNPPVVESNEANNCKEYPTPFIVPALHIARASDTPVGRTLTQDATNIELTRLTFNMATSNRGINGLKIWGKCPSTTDNINFPNTIKLINTYDGSVLGTAPFDAQTKFAYFVFPSPWIIGVGQAAERTLSVQTDNIVSNTLLNTWCSFGIKSAQDVTTLDALTVGGPPAYGNEFKVIKPTIAFNRPSYSMPNTDVSARVTINSSGANVSADQKNNINVKLTSGEDSAVGLTLIAQETGNNTGVFQTIFNLNHTRAEKTTPAAKRLRVRNCAADIVTASYSYSNNNGVTATAGTSPAVGACGAAFITPESPTSTATALSAPSEPESLSDEGNGRGLISLFGSFLPVAYAHGGDGEPIGQTPTPYDPVYVYDDLYVYGNDAREPGNLFLNGTIVAPYADLQVANLQSTSDLWILGAANVESLNVATNANISEISNNLTIGNATTPRDLSVTGNISANAIGQFYTIGNVTNTYTRLGGVESAAHSATTNTSCGPGDIIMSCTGGYNTLLLPNFYFGGAIIDNQKRCNAIASRIGFIGTPDLFVQAVCFNPDRSALPAGATELTPM